MPSVHSASSRRTHSAADVTRPTTQAIASAAVTRLFQTQQRRRQIQSQQQPGGRPPWQESFTSKVPITEAEIGSMRSTQFASSEDKSCFMVTAKKQFHGIAFPPDAKGVLQNNHPSAVEQQVEFQKAMSILRHEESMAKRRVMDGFLNLTGAQVDTHLTVPNQSYAESVLRSRGGNSWVLNNAHRQQITPAGVPVMTEIMRGEYYLPQPKPRREVTNHIVANKRNVASASYVSKMLPVPSSAHCCNNMHRPRPSSSNRRLSCSR